MRPTITSFHTAKEIAVYPRPNGARIAQSPKAATVQLTPFIPSVSSLRARHSAKMAIAMPTITSSVAAVPL